MRYALVFLMAAACGSPHGGTTGDDVVPGDDAGDDGGGGGDDASVDCDCLDALGKHADAAVDAAHADAPADAPADSPPPVDSPPAMSCPTWCAETPPSGAGRLFAVYAVDADNVFAVGDGGTIIRRTSGGWSAMTSGTTQNLRGVWAASTSDVWAVGENGTILRFDGSAWSAVTGVTTNNVNGVWGAGSNDVWLAGTGKMFHWTGTWANNTVAGSLQQLAGTGTHDIWLATEGAYLKHYTGSTWATVMPTGGMSTIFGVAAIATNDVWSSSGPPGHEMLHYNGSTWTGYSTSSAIFGSLYGAAGNDVWGVGGTKVGHWTGSSWAISTPTGITMALWGVHGHGSDVYVVGAGPTILHHN